MKIAPLLFAAVLATALTSCMNDGHHDHPKYCKDYSKEPVKSMISLDQAKSIADAYRADKSKALIEGTDTPDANAISFPLEDLKQYIWRIEDTLTKQGCNLEQLNLSFRFYYGKYPDSSQIKEYGVDPAYALHHTVFIVPTYKGKSGEIDFNPFNIGPDPKAPWPLATQMRRGGDDAGMQKRSGGTDGGGGSGTTPAFNHGSLVPPPSSGGAFPAGK